MAWSSDCPYGTTATSQFRLIVAFLSRTNHNNTVGRNPRHAVGGGRSVISGPPKGLLGMQSDQSSAAPRTPRSNTEAVGEPVLQGANLGWKVHVDRWQLPVPRTGCPSQAGGPDLSGDGFPVPMAHPCSRPETGAAGAAKLADWMREHGIHNPIHTLKAGLPALETGASYPEFCSSPMQKKPGPASGSEQTAILQPPKLPPVLVPNARSPTGQENLPVGQPDLTSWYWRLPSTFAWRTWGRSWRTGPAPVGPGNGEYGCG